MGPAGEREREFRELWRRYFKTIAIEGRLNPKCQSTHMPKRYRHVMTEFMEDGEPQRGMDAPCRSKVYSLEEGHK